MPTKLIVKSKYPSLLIALKDEAEKLGWINFAKCHTNVMFANLPQYITNPNLSLRFIRSMNEPKKRFWLSYYPVLTSIEKDIIYNLPYDWDKVIYLLSITANQTPNPHSKELEDLEKVWKDLDDVPFRVTNNLIKSLNELKNAPKKDKHDLFQYYHVAFDGTPLTIQYSMNDVVVRTLRFKK